MTDDPFPSAAFWALVRRLPAYARLAWRLARDPLVPRARRVALAAAAAYAASPVDAVPGIVPVLGQLDDIAFVLLAVRSALGVLSADQRTAHLTAVGLSDDALRTDLATVGATTAWIVRAGVRTGVRVATVGSRAAARGARTVAGSGVRLGRAAVERAQRRREPPSTR